MIQMALKWSAALATVLSPLHVLLAQPQVQVPPLTPPFAASGAQPGTPQAASFPPAPVPQQSSQAQIRAAFPPSNLGPGSYQVGPQNGVATLPPLSPPGGAGGSSVDAIASPLSDDQIRELRTKVEGTRRATAYKPVRSVPRVSSETVDLSPGAPPPILRTIPEEMSTVVFLDSTGAPWPLADIPRIADSRKFSVEGIKDGPSVMVSALTSYGESNMTIFLKGLATPVVVKIVSGEPDSRSKTRVVDYRRDLRIPGRGPNAHMATLGQEQIALYDDTLQAFLDGIPPKGAKALKAGGEKSNRAKVWDFAGSMFVRTSLDIQTAFEQCMTAADGTKVYRLAATPYVTLSEGGQSFTLQIDIN